MNQNNMSLVYLLLVVQQNIRSPDRLVRNTEHFDPGVFLWIPAQLVI